MADSDSPSKPATQPATTTATLTAALVGLAALLPGKVLPTAAGMLAPFVSQGIMWLAREWANEWLAERKAQAPTRRAERYLHQMTKQLDRLKPNDPTRSSLELKIAQLADRLHEHKLSQLELKNAPPSALPANNP